jgi:sequestosome 1
MGEPQMGNQENKSESNNTSNENQKAHAAQEAQKEATTSATGAASSSDQEAMKAAFEQFATMTGSAEYLKNVGNFVAAALDPFGIDVQVNVETPEGTKQEASNSTSVSSSSSTPDVEEGNKAEQKDAEKADAEKSKSPALDEEWTVVTDKEEEANAVNITIKPTGNPGTDSLYPSLPENSTASTASPAAVAAAPPTAPAAAEPEPVASHPDPKIQVALQAMINMGFSNEGGWMTSLLEAKNGDISKVLDILQPVRK